MARRSPKTPAPVTQFNGWIAPGDDPRNLEVLTSPVNDRVFSFCVWFTERLGGWHYRVNGPCGYSTSYTRVSSMEEGFQKVQEEVARDPDNRGNLSW